MQGTHAVILQKQTEIKARAHNIAYAKACSCKGYNILILTNAKSTGKNKNAKTISILWQRKKLNNPQEGLEFHDLYAQQPEVDNGS